MPWVRLDEEFADHPKIVKAGPLALALHVAALCYCNRYLTDGFVPEGKAKVLLDLAGKTDDTIGALLEAGLWSITEGGYGIHDFLEYQPSKADVIAQRKARAIAGRKGADARWHGNEDGKSHSNSHTNEIAKECPVPGPVPVTGTDTAPQNSESEVDARKRAQSRKNIEAAKWKPTVELLEWAGDNHPQVDLVNETEKFIDHFSANGKPMKDWNAAWRNWIRRAPQFNKAVTG